ncbi:MAG: hypothetical protein KDD83_15895 [Caldilineaceae bacterium]|nr:hypothetical protein [Caldilineaceae bacterium]
MTKRIEVEVPEDWLDEQGRLPVETANEIVRLGLEQLKIAQALTIYQSGAGSLGFAAESVGVAKRILIQAARLRGILPAFDDQTVREEMGTAPTTDNQR